MKSLACGAAVSMAVGLAFLLGCGDDTGAGGTASGGASATGTQATGTQAATGSTHAATGSAQTVTGSTGPGSGSDTWDNFGQQFFVTYCVECHDAGDPARNYTTLAPVVAEAAEIRCGVGPVIESGCTGFPPPNQFPIDNADHSNAKPTEAERNRLVAWIDAGTPN